MASVKPSRKLTAAEYLEIDRAAEGKSEFFGGEMFDMAGGMRWHSRITTNLTYELSGRLADNRCVVYNADLRIKVEMAGLYTYPDLSVVCGEQRFEDEREDTLLNPTVIVEVLSESCEAYDRGKKFELYRLIPSLREYILVSQWEPRIEQFLRQGSGEWLLRDAAGLESNLTLPALDVVVPLAGIYAKVDFAVAAARRDVRYFAQTQAVDDP